MTKLENVLVKYIWLVVLALSIPAVWALFVPGYFGASDDLHVAWLFEMDHTLKLGQFPPRYVPDLSYQFGYPLFNFVFPLPFYLGEIFHQLGLNLVDSVKSVFLISVPLSMYWMYKLLKEFSGTLLSLAAAVLYVYTPYRATDLYVRGAIGEIVGFALLPLVCLSMIKVFTSDKIDQLKWIGIGALSIGALVLTHDITAYMFFPLVAVLGILFFITSYKSRKTFLILVGMGVLGLLISLYFWLPAIVDSKLMKYDTVFNFEDHFPTIKQLITPFWGYGASVAGPYDGMSFFIGIVNLLAILISVPVLIFWRKKFTKKELLFLGWGYAVFLIAFGMMNYRAIPLWKVLPELPYFQFPWRFLILTTFVTPLFLIVLEKFKYSRYIGMGLIVVIISINAFQFRPHDFLGRTDAYYLDRYVPYPIASEAYKQTQEEYLRLPKNTQQRPDQIYPSFFSNQAMGAVPIRTNPLDYEARIGVTSSTQVSFNKYLLPGWQIAIDGSPIDPEVGQPFGQVSFPLNSGNHDVRVFYKETAFNFLLDIVSLLSLLLACFLIFPHREVSKKWFKFKRSHNHVN